MNMDSLILMVLALLTTGAAIGLMMAWRRSQVLAAHTSPRGFWIGMGVSLGIAIGSALGIALENPGIGIALGIPIGAGIRLSLEKRYRDDRRPWPVGSKWWKWSMGIGIMALLVLVLIVIICLVSR